jgi:hypothetical protein
MGLSSSDARHRQEKAFDGDCIPKPLLAIQPTCKQVGFLAFST